MSAPPPAILRLLLDAGASFPYTPLSPSAARQTTLSWSATPTPASALALLPPAEHAKVLKYYHPKDAALSLASHLLKHLAITRTLSIPWSATHLTQERHLSNGKPFFAPGGLDFNVSHHGALAVLAAAPGSNCKVGVDVVQVNAAHDVRSVARAGGWRAWSSVFDEAFSPAEVARIHAAVPVADDKQVVADVKALDAALRVFYAHWALKEAYIKMTSDAFMATWLRELEFRGVTVPEPGMAAGEAGAGVEAAIAETEWAEGETVRGIEVWLRGARVRDVQVELQAVGAGYMVATATSCPSSVGPLERIIVERDVAPLAARSGFQTE